MNDARPGRLHSSTMATKAERLTEVYRRIAQLARPGSAQECLDQFCRVLDEVEDALSGVPKQCPPPADGGGRMYFPLTDRTAHLADGAIEAVATGHIIRVSADGGIVISNRQSGEVEFER